MTRALVTVGTVALLAPASAAGQGSALVPPHPPRTVTVAAGPEYRAGWLHELVFGRHYRNLWATPIAVEVLDLGAFAGGLTPLRRGGGAQTRSLRFAGANDHEYVFRSVNKHPSWLPVELRETIAERALRDQVSLLHPGAALVAAPLVGAAGVLHAQPQLFVMPDDPRLGEYRAEFAGMLGIVEERPREGLNGEGFGGASDVAGSDRMLQLVRSSSRDRVDARAFLAARLLDLFLGDGDRHADQWRWARFDENDRRVWRPIPRDRDEAFARFDGLAPRLARINHPDLVGFGYDYGSVYGLSWRAEDLDRLFLAELERPAWDSTVRAIQSRLTDSVIDAAVRRLPPEYYRTNGAELAGALTHRRDGLPGAAHDLYALLARDVDIRLTMEPEFVAVQRLADGRVSVRVSRRDAVRGPATAPYFVRTFDRAETNEIRVYLAGRDDSVMVSGRAARSILVRVIADSAGGSAVLVDSSHVSGGGRLTRVYDGRAAVRVVPGSTTSVDRRRLRPQPRPDVFHAEPRDRGEAWMPGAWVSFQPDVGVIGSAGATLRTYGFRRFPYQSSMSFRLAFATGAGKFGAEYTADFRTTTAVRFAVRARWSGFDVVRFYGLGNETAFNGSTDFYKVKQQQYVVAPSVVVPVGRSLELSAGPLLKYAHTTLEPGTLAYALRPYGSGSWGQVGVQAGFRFDTRDRAVAATRGVLFAATGAAYPAFWDVTAPFQEVHGEAATYLSAAIPTRPTLALRLAGKKVWGPFPFQEAAFVGGLATVRGYSEHRFAGSAGAFANAELRLRLARPTLVLPGDFGIFGLADVGRVYVSGEQSDRWHAAVGGGIWFAPLYASNTVSVAMTRSPERTATYLRLGFAF